MQIDFAVYLLFIIFYILYFNYINILHAKFVDGLQPQQDDRPPSQFKVGDEWLALPEVFSNLDFYADK